MTFIYPFVFFLFIPLFILYKYETFATERYKRRARLLLYLSISFAILALSRPVILNTLDKQKFDAQDFIVAIDASYSMQATDLEPTRYIVAKETLKEIIKALPKNRFSIFAFTSNTILISPPTTDSAISFMALDSLEPKYILTKGTSLIELLKTVSKISYEKKSLIIFSDGGEDYDLDVLVKVAKNNNIIPYVVATGSSNGSILTLNDKNIKDENNNLVISRINPILKDFASLSGGKYYVLNSLNSNVVEQILSDINGATNKSQKIEIDVLTYTELFYFGIALSIISFLMAVTKIHELYVLIPLILIPQTAHSKILDFYHLNNANSAFKELNYVQSANEFDKLTPSVKSYYNKAIAYYKAGQYKKAIQIFESIKTTDILLKQSIFYNMGNCAVKLQKFQRAKIYYQHALSLGYDADSMHNLTLLYQLNLKEKQDVSDMLPKNEVKKQTQAKEKPPKNEDKQDSSKSSSSKSQHKASESSDGSSNAKGKEKKQAMKKIDKPLSSQYKIGYKAYELINKGYTDEKNPW